MAIKYQLLPKAESDYFAIYAYTYEKFGETQAEKYTEGLLDAFTLITEHHRIGRKIAHIRTGYYCFDYKSHSIFYKQDGRKIVIVRVLGNRQDPSRHL